MILRYLFAGLLAVALSTDAAELQASAAWIGDAPTAAPMRAGYVELHNATDQVIEIVAASSARFGLVEMHETRVEAGVARMIELPSVSIPPGGTFSFSPGGAHFMLMRRQGSLSKGETCPIRLSFNDGSEQDIVFRIGVMPGAD